MGHESLTKVFIVKFRKKIPLTNMSKNDATLCLVIDFNDFSKHCSIVIGINFSKKNFP